MADSQLYSRLLLPKGHGYPLFRPQPPEDLPNEYRTTGVSIGDVGVITVDGYFDVVFNICAPADSAVNRRGVPEGFEPLVLEPGSIFTMGQHHEPGCDISSTNISKRRLDADGGLQDNLFLPVGAGGLIEVTSSSREVAMLLLPHGASRCNLRFLERFREYALLNALQWYSFVNGTCGRRVENGSLYLVTGADKSTSWSVASVKNQSSSGQISMKLTAALTGAGGVSYRWRWQGENSASVASGPHTNPGEEDWTNNQTVFLRGYKVLVRSTPVASLNGSIKVSPISALKPGNILRRSSVVPFSQSSSLKSRIFGNRKSGGSSDDSERDLVGDVESIPTSEPYHPSNIINSYLLNTATHATVCVTHDDVWMSVLQDEDSEFPTDEELLRRIRQKYCITVEHGGASLGLSSESVDWNSPAVPIASGPTFTSLRPSRRFVSWRLPHAVQFLSRTRQNQIPSQDTQHPAHPVQGHISDDELDVLADAVRVRPTF